MSPAIKTFEVLEEAETDQLATQISQLLRTGDTILLEGDIGAGKTAFCRALIKAQCGPATDVPSPTFTIVQTYDANDFEIWHCDLYRLGGPDDILELGLDAAFEDAVVLVEWPDRLGDLKPSDALELSISLVGDYRRFSFSGSAKWAKRLGDLNV